jgi:hypothetical protein
MDCQFCTGSVATKVLKPRGGVDLKNIPTHWARDVERLIVNGFCACSECAVLLRAADDAALEARLARALGAEPWHDGEKRERWVSEFVRAMLVQNVIRTVGGVCAGETVSLYQHLQPGFRMWCDLYNVSKSEELMEPLDLDVQVKGWALRDDFHLEELISNRRGCGNASRTLRFITAAADLHAVRLVGKVEPLIVAEADPGLTSDELYAWYARHGFVRTREFAPNGIVRYPSNGRASLRVARADIKQARHELKNSVRDPESCSPPEIDPSGNGECNR